jgi:hypothetical protein
MSKTKTKPESTTKQPTKVLIKTDREGMESLYGIIDEVRNSSAFCDTDEGIFTLTLKGNEIKAEWTSAVEETYSETIKLLP